MPMWNIVVSPGLHSGAVTAIALLLLLLLLLLLMSNGWFWQDTRARRHVTGEPFMM
jgi:hypothetical protein